RETSASSPETRSIRPPGRPPPSPTRPDGDLKAEFRRRSEPVVVSRRRTARQEESNPLGRSRRGLQPVASPLPLGRRRRRRGILHRERDGPSATRRGRAERTTSSGG